MPSPRPAGPAPTRDDLRQAALRHVGRFASTTASLGRVLDRRVSRWARQAGLEGQSVEAERAQAGRDVRAVVEELAGAGIVDDAAFAAARASRLVRAGRSRRTVAAHLAAKGIEPGIAAAVLPQSDAVASALAYARRRRIGPFRTGMASDGADVRLKELGAMARAGFDRDVAERALDTPAETAASMVDALRRG